MALMKREKCSVELSDKEAKVRFSLGCLEAFAIAELKRRYRDELKEIYADMIETAVMYKEVYDKGGEDGVVPMFGFQKQYMWFRLDFEERDATIIGLGERK